MKKGFTLIELMVVISLMGLICFIVVASMDSAREKGRDATMQSQFASLRAKAEIFYNKYNTFGMAQEIDNYNLCTAASNEYGFGGVGGPGLLVDIANSADLDPSKYLFTQNTYHGAWNYVTCHSNKASDDGTDAWVVEAPFSTSASGHPIMLCVDSTGITKTKNSTLKGAPNNNSSLGLSCGDQDSDNL